MASLSPPPYSISGERLTEEEADQLIRSNKRVRKTRLRPRRDRAEEARTDSEMAGAEEPLAEGGKRKFTFRDMVMGCKAVDVMVDDPEVDLEVEMEECEEEEGCYEADDVQFTTEQLRNFRTPWRSSLIIKVLGKRVGYLYMYRRLLAMWRPRGGFKLISLSHDYFIARFDMKEDRERVLLEGPWKILDHYLAVRRWTPRFRPSKATIDRAALWIRILDCPMELYNEAGMRGIGDFIGRTVKIDMTTQGSEMGNYARICVEIDLTKSLRSDFTVLGDRYTIQYEAIHLVCFHCGLFGHKQEDCPDSLGSTSPEGCREEVKSACPADSTKEARDEILRVEPTFSAPTPPVRSAAPPPATPAGRGPWMLVEKQKRKMGNQVGAKSGGLGANSGKHGRFRGEKSGGGSRFTVLEDFVEENEGTFHEGRDGAVAEDATVFGSIEGNGPLRRWQKKKVVASSGPAHDDSPPFPSAVQQSRTGPSNLKQPNSSARPQEQAGSLKLSGPSRLQTTPSMETIPGPRFLSHGLDLSAMNAPFKFSAQPNLHGRPPIMQIKSHEPPHHPPRRTFAWRGYFHEIDHDRRTRCSAAFPCLRERI